MVPAPQGVGSHWMVLDMAAGVAVFSSANLLVDILLESAGIVLGGYRETWMTNWSGVFPGYERVWLDRSGHTNILSLSEVSLREETQANHDLLTGDGLWSPF